MRFLLLLFISIGMLALQSCKRDCQDPSNPDCENYDPCFGTEKTSADFTISEVVGGRAFETDVVRRNSFVQFTAKQDFDSYQWVIGNHKDTFYTKTCGLSHFPEGSTTQVRLVGIRQPNTGCYPNDDGIDTFYKTFRVTDHDSLLPIYGEYEGYYSHAPNKKVTVRVWRTTTPDFPTWRAKPFFEDIPVQGSYISDWYSPGAVAFHFDANGHDNGYRGGYGMTGHVYLLPDKVTLKAEYTHWDTASRYPNFVRISGSFTGKRK